MFVAGGDGGLLPACSGPVGAGGRGFSAEGDEWEKRRACVRRRPENNAKPFSTSVSFGFINKNGQRGGRSTTVLLGAHERGSPGSLRALQTREEEPDQRRRFCVGV